MRAFAYGSVRRAWWLLSALLAALVLVLLPSAVRGEALTITDRENLESAFEFLEANGHAADVAQLRDMARRGHIQRGEIAGEDNAETVRQVITVRSNVFGGLNAPGSINRFQTATFLAEVLLHELAHVRQYRPIGADPANAANERAAWGTWMQATFNWITARERRLATASGAERQRLAQELRILRTDLVTGYAGLRDRNIGNVYVTTPDGAPLAPDSALRYLDGVEQQAVAALRGDALTAADRPTEADLAALRADELRHAQADVARIQAALAAHSRRVWDTREALRQMRDSLRFGRDWFDEYARTLDALLRMCAAASDHESQGRRLIAAALGAEQAVDRQLQFARSVGCSGSADLDALNAAFAQALNDAANAERLLVDGAALAVNVSDVYAQMAQKYPVITGPGAVADLQRQAGEQGRKAYFEHFKPTGEAMGPRIDDLAAAQRDVGAARGELKVLLQRLTTEPALRDRPEIMALAQRAGGELAGALGPRDDVTPAELQTLREDQRDLTAAGWRAFDELDRAARTKARCGDRAVLQQAAERARPTVAFARMKLAAIDELRQRCAGMLAAQPMPPPVAVAPPPVVAPPPGLAPPPAPVSPVGPVGTGNPNVMGGMFIAGPALMSVGQGTTFRAIDAGGRIYPGAVFTTSNETVVRIGSGGQAVANRTGSAIVFARAGDMSASLQVQVAAAAASAAAPATTAPAPPARQGPYNPAGTGQPCPDLAQQAQAQCQQIVADCKARNCAGGGYSGCAVDCPGCGNFGDYVAWCPLHPSYRGLIAGGLAAHVAEVQTCAQRFLADRQPGRRERAAACQGESLKRLNDRFAQWIAQACSARCAQDGRAGAIRVMPHRCECQ